MILSLTPLGAGGTFSASAKSKSQVFSGLQIKKIGSEDSILVETMETVYAAPVRVLIKAMKQLGYETTTRKPKKARKR